jgi:hypothetical protein
MSEDLPAAASTWRKSVIRVGGGRGFVLARERRRYVATATHCLPFLPPATGASSLEERTAMDLLGPLGEEPSVAAEIVFMDPIADIALLEEPDSQEFSEQAAAYRALTEATPQLPLTALAFVRQEHRLPDGFSFRGPPEAAADAWMLALEGDWFACRLTVRRSTWIWDAAKPIVPGMSGSPIISHGGGVGIVSLSSGTSGSPHHEGGPNPYLPFALPGWMVPRALRPRSR